MKEEKNSRPQEGRGELSERGTDTQSWRAAPHGASPLLLQPPHKARAVLPVVLQLVLLSEKLLTELSKLLYRRARKTKQRSEAYLLHCFP